MPNFLGDAMTWLHGQRHALMSEPVSYQRISGGSALSIQGSKGRTAGEKLQESEFSGSAGVMDWLFRAEDFIVSGEFTPPAMRDRVTESDGTLWEVVEIPGEPVWRYSDAFRNAIRVHVVETALPPAPPPPPPPFAITAQPEDVVAANGATVQFSVTVANPQGTVQYQWQRNPNGTLFANWQNTGPNANTFAFETVFPEMLGDWYRCVVSDGTTTIESDFAQLTEDIG